MRIDAVCDIESFRRFMILSTCHSFIPEEFLDDEKIFPERSADAGTMYVEAEDKVTLQQVREIRFTSVTNILGIIYNSRSGRTRLKWRHLKNSLGRLIGEASPNTLVNLYDSGALRLSYAKRPRRPWPSEGEPAIQVGAEQSLDYSF